MAINTKMPLTNTADGYLCLGTDIKGGYFVIDQIENISTRIAETGSLCFVTGTATVPVNEFYQFNGENWVPAQLRAQFDAAQHSELLNLLSCIEIEIVEE